jgi:predicted transcriptional regulator of viral defense system
MKAILLKELEKHVIFNRGIVAGIVKSESYAGVLIHRLKKTGQILEIERDRYTVHRDPFLVASRITWPSYISIWSALRYHNLTEQVPHAIWVVTTKKRRNTKIEFAGTDISFIIASPKYFFGYDKIDFRGFEIFIADPEKCIIDGMLFRKISVLEIFNILRNNLQSLRIGRLTDYAIRTGNKALIKRMGFLLERLDVPIRHKLEKFIYPARTPLEYNFPPKGRLDDNWMIVENVEL